MKRLITLSLVMIALLLIAAACAGNSDDKDESVIVKLNDANGDVFATATLTEDDDVVTIKLKGDGLTQGSHAFHVHEKGSCDAPDFESAGGHYNPEDKNHGKKDIDGPHAGDFENIDVDSNGKIDVAFTTTQITLEKDQANTLFTDDGTSLVIHADADNYESQPAGDAGDRIACGVVESN